MKHSAVVLSVILALTLLAVPVLSLAQQPPKVYRIDWLSGVEPSTPEFVRQDRLSA